MILWVFINVVWLSSHWYLTYINFSYKIWHYSSAKQKNDQELRRQEDRLDNLQRELETVNVKYSFNEKIDVRFIYTILTALMQFYDISSQSKCMLCHLRYVFFTLTKEMLTIAILFLFSLGLMLFQKCLERVIRRLFLFTFGEW